jgi:hypothetical protein
MSNHPITVSLPLGQFSGDSHVPLIHVADGFGGITVLEAALVAGGAGTAIGGILVTAADISSTGGTPAINGTVGSFAGTVVTAVGGANLLTITNSYVAEDYWLGYDQASGTVPSGAYISLTYLHGK